jgi:hypothetical protein
MTVMKLIKTRGAGASIKPGVKAEAEPHDHMEEGTLARGVGDRARDEYGLRSKGSTTQISPRSAVARSHGLCALNLIRS